MRLAFALLLAGCNGLIGIGPPGLETDGGAGADAATDAATADAVPPDAGDPDANLTPTVRGALTVLDTQLTDPILPLTPVGAVRGGAVRFRFDDLTDPGGGGEVVFQGGPGAPFGSCLVTRFDATHLPRQRLDAGPITVSGAGLLKTVGPCRFQPSLGEYRCISHDVAGTATVIAQSSGSGAVAYVLAAPSPFLGMTTPVAVAAAVRGPAGAVPANTVEITTAAPHGFATDQFVTIAGSGTFNSGGALVTVTGASTFRYSQPGAVETGATLGTASGARNLITGSTLVVNGLTTGADAARFNSGSGSFPIVAQINATTVLVYNAATLALPVGTVSQGTAASYTITNGSSPVGTSTYFVDFHDFLTGAAAPATAPLRLEKAASPVWGAIDLTVDVPGEAPPAVAVTTLARAGGVVTATLPTGHGVSAGQRITIAGSALASYDGTFTVTTATATTFTYAQAGTDEAATAAGTARKPGFALDTGPATGGASQQPYVFPTTAADLNYSCDNNTAADSTDDTCGDESTSTLRALIATGTATRRPLAGLYPFQMPSEVAAGEWLEWRCIYLLSKSVDLPAAAVQAILDFQPTRVEQQVQFVAGAILDDGVNVGGLEVLTGHALAGHTTFCPAAGPGLDALGQPLCAACNDGVDNDGDGAIDLLDDGCSSAADLLETP